MSVQTDLHDPIRRILLGPDTPAADPSVDSVFHGTTPLALTADALNLLSGDWGRLGPGLRLVLATEYRSLQTLIGGKIQLRSIEHNWDELLRLAASIRTGTVTASRMLRKLGSYPRQNSLALALRELGRIERTLFTIDWLE